MPKLHASRRALRYGAAALVFLAWIGCSKAPPDFELKLEAPGAGDFTQYKLVVDGVPRGPVASTLPYQLVAHGRRGDKPKDMLPHVEASVLSVCGWQPAKVEMSPPSEHEIEQARKEKRSVPLTIYLDSDKTFWQQVTALVDNRGGAALRLAVGEYEQPVAAGEAGKVLFPYTPHCDQARDLRLNGETIGKIEEDPNTPGTALPLLLDTSGAHCYRYEWATYSNFPAMPGGSGHRIYKAQRLRTLTSNVNYFLFPLPGVQYSSQTIEWKSALNDIACKNAK
ncbi:MAG: hypothetical protein LAO20_06265 [Acidobacteriia bacterium]|nr:hypothetical protein [Terriglobia bacterium]